MKQKYLITRNETDEILVVQEYGELDKEVLSLLCEEHFDDAVIRKSMESGREALIAILRTRNLYPPKAYSERIAAAVETLYGSAENESIELFFDDLDLLHREQQAAALIDESDEESGEIDELLDDNFEDEYEDGEAPIKEVNDTLKIADDDPGDIEDDI